MIGSPTAGKHSVAGIHLAILEEKQIRGVFASSPRIAAHYSGTLGIKSFSISCKPNET